MWPKLTNIEGKIYNRILEKSKVENASKLNAWIRVFSGAVVNNNKGLIFGGNTALELFRAAGQNTATIYGDTASSGVLGVSWDGKVVGGGADRGFRPSPIITGFDVKEGTDQISREGNLQVKCFSLYQLEYLQKYLMEPGYSLCIEWGWNTTFAGKNIIDDKAGVSGILQQSTNINLDYNKLHSKRVLSQGDYDSYLGFIVGCSVKNDGENFTLDIKMKGSPSLPTFMQLQTKVQKTDKENGKIIEPESVEPFNSDDLIEEGDSSEIATRRRFRKMFNSLPTHRQLQEIKNTESTSNWYDFIGFDEIIGEKIIDFNDGGNVFTSGDGGDEIEIDGVEIKKDGFLSDKKFIRMDLLVDILNRNGSIQSIQIGEQKIKLQFDISESVIGAFPFMFSTNSDKLIIPGTIPDFSTYYLNSSKVEQGKNGIFSVSGEQVNPIDTSPDFNGISFVQNTDLNKFGLKEKAGRWGYLKDLYVNFNVFHRALESTNKNIREVFIDILNECSSAVNSFWNFQIVEKSKNDKTIVYEVIDENWIGKSPTEEKVKEFYHSGVDSKGVGSPFLDATLDLNLPAQMASQIVMRRLGYATNPDEPITGMGSFFSKSTDLFLQNAINSDGSRNTNEVDNNSFEVEEVPLKPSEQLTNEVASLNTQIQNEKASLDNLKKLRSEARKRGDYGLARELDGQIRNIDNRIIGNQQKVNNKTDEIKKEKRKEKKAEEEKIKKSKAANLTANLEKLTILPKPSIKSLDTLKNNTLILKENAVELFGFYTFKDGGYFDLLRNDTHATDKGTGKLSQPLPIKYSFTILGSSGLRRGDMFNINGIPNIYRQQGLFQIVNVSHQLDGMTWKTTVEGAYRQKQ